MHETEQNGSRKSFDGKTMRKFCKLPASIIHLMQEKLHTINQCEYLGFYNAYNTEFIMQLEV